MPSTLSMCNDVLREYARAEALSVHVPVLRRSLAPLVLTSSPIPSFGCPCNMLFGSMYRR
jgi:hypothetical protein